MNFSNNLPFIIAEVGSVHDGSFGNAKKLIELVAKCGAHAVKFQTHLPEFESTINAPSPIYFNEESRYEYFKRTQFNLEQWIELRKFAHKLRIKFISSPFSIEALKLLIKIKCDFIKIPSGEITNLPLIKKAYDSNKSVILSSGMSSWNELNKAVKIFKTKKNLGIMQCTSSYPCQLKEVGLNIIPEMKRKYNIPIGFSDHTEGFEAAIGAVYSGATFIEKHITFSRSMYGSDAKFAMEPQNFQKFCTYLKNSYFLMNYKIYKNKIPKKIHSMKKIFEKSIVAAKNLEKGHKLKLDDLSLKKPGTGISPYFINKVTGKKLNSNLRKDSQILWKNLK